MEHAVPLPYSIHVGNRVASDENLCGESSGRPGWAVYNAFLGGDRPVYKVTRRPRLPQSLAATLRKV